MKLKTENTYKTILSENIIKITAIGLFLGIFLSVIQIENVSASGTISGTVYVDYNMNGTRDMSGSAPNLAVDNGVSGVIVTVYAPNGTSKSTTTGTNGTYSLDTSAAPALPNGPYRIEFTNLPSGYYPSAVGTNNDSTVRFVANGTSTGNDFGITRNCDFCQDNPLIVTPEFVNGNNISAGDSLVALRYNASGSFLSFGDTNDTGAAWGLAWRRKDKKLLVSSVLKRHSGFGPGKDGVRGNADDISTIYVYDYNNPGTNGEATINNSQAINLGLLGINVGTNPRLNSTPANDLGTPTQPNHDYGVFTNVGKRGIGGVALSEDENTLYVVNLNSAQRQLISLNVSNLNNVTLNGSYSIPNPGCAAGDYYAPWAVKVNQGKPYVGIVCTADVSQNYSNLRAYLLRLDGSNFTTIDLDSTSANDYISLNYDRTFGYSSSNGGSGSGRAEWRPWLNSFPSNIITTYNKSYATPIFSDMEFHSDGSLSIGLMDRSGHQIGYGNYAESGTNLYDYISSGDVLKVCNSGGNYIPEGNTGCSQPTAGIYDAPANASLTPPEIAGTPNEFYNDSSLRGGAGSDGHLETFFGGMASIPGVNELAMVQMNPLPTIHAGGFRWVSTTDGSAFQNYTLYQNPNSSTTNSTYGKSNGLGDIEMLCDPAPLQIGNRVWNDTNGNGVQDSGENPIPGVTVQLFADTDNNGTPDTQVGSATTDINGNYIFGGIYNANLIANPTCSATVTTSSRVNQSSDDAYQRTNSTVNLTFGSVPLGINATVTDNGVRFTGINVPKGATITNAYIQFTSDNTVANNNGTTPVTIKVENVDNAATYTTANNNITSRSTIGSIPWTVPNWTTADQAGVNQRTPDLSSIVQQIVNRNGWASGNAMAFTLTSNGANRVDAESYDGSSANAPQLIIEYKNCNVKADTSYEVRIPSSNFSGALTGLIPTTANANDTVGNGDARDSDGIVLSGNQVIAPFTTGKNGQNNHSYDFGFRAGTSSYSVGNRIWFDTNNDGIINAGEVGISGVSVSIFLDADGNGAPDNVGSPISTINTDTNGYYRFDSLAANNYVIRVNGSNFGSGGVLRGYRNTANSATPTDDGRDSSGAAMNAENGIDTTGAVNTILTNGILSNSFTLSGVLEPQSEPDVPSTGAYAGQGSLDNQADMTVDFGFYKLTLSGTAWSDTGLGLGQFNNGILDTGESRLIGYRTSLYTAAGVEIPVGNDGILGTADDAPGGMLTNGTGDYSFMGLPGGSYRVVINSNGGVSSTPTENDPNLNIDNNDNGFPDNTGNFPGRFISGIVNLTPGNVGAAGNNSVTNSNGTTTDPTIDFGVILGPTLVKLDKFDAYFDGNNVVVEWSTGDESRNLGFNVYREVFGQKELLTNAPIAGSALKTTVDLKVKGNSYSWIDKESKLGGVYYLEDIDLEGNTTMHGPIQPNMKFSLDSSKQVSSQLLTDLVKPELRVEQQEYIGEISNRNNTNDGLWHSEESSNVDKQREIAAMKGVKLFVKNTGWYSVDMNQLAQSGFDINSNKDMWQLFVGGNEVPLRISYKRQSNSFAVEFYGEGIDTNISNEQVYYLVKGNQAGMRLPEIKSRPISGAADSLGYDVTVQRKDRSIYISSLLNGDKENWFGGIITATAVNNQDLIVNNPFDDGVTQAVLRVRMQGLTSVDHFVNVSFNNVQIGTVDFGSKDNEEFEFNIPMSSVIEGVNQIGLQSVGAGNDISLVDSVSLRYTRSYTAKNNRIRFSVPADQTARIGGFSDNGVKVFEINNGAAIRELGIQEEKVNNTVGFSLLAANYDRELIAIVDSGYVENVARIEANMPSMLHRTDNKADLIIITPNVFDKEAKELSERRQAQGWRTGVVQIEDIYDEYNFGMRSSQAIKDFLLDASTNWEVKPDYVLLFGDSSYDQRNYLNQTNRDLIPTKLIDTEFMETSSDGWLADFDNDGVEDLSLGRLPVNNSAEARHMLVKLLRYDQQGTREQNTNLLVADNYFEVYNDSLENHLPQGAGAIRINRSQMSDPQMRSDIISKVGLDPMVVTYTGHGTTGVWASANVLRDTDVSNFANSKLSFFMLMTCLNGYTSNAYGDSLSEALVKTENGAIAVWASSGSTYASGQIYMSQRATQDLFNLSQNPMTIGEVTRAAKQTTNDLDARRTWQLIGDPTIVIK